MSNLKHWPHLIFLLSVGITSTPLIPTGNSARPLTLLLAVPVLATHLMRKGRFESPWLNISIIALCIYLLILQIFVAANPNTQILFSFKGNSYSEDVTAAALSVIAFAVHYFAFMAAALALGFTKFSKALVYGFTISALVGVVQWVFNQVGLATLSDAVTSTLSVSAIVWQDRVRGLAFEPSWLASQITVFLIPLLAYRHFVLRRSFLIIRFERGRIPIEGVLGVVGVVALAMTFSRGGLVALMGTAIVLILYLSKNVTRVSNVFRTAVIVITVASLAYAASGNAYVASALGGVRQAGSANARAAFATANAGPRFAAWESSVDTFRRHPYFGVGLGLQHRYFAVAPPIWSAGLPEVQSWLNSNVPDRANPKNIVLKLMCEAGVLGLLLFAAPFVLALSRSRNWTLALFMAPALLVDFFSLDSLALITYPLAIVLFSEARRES